MPNIRQLSLDEVKDVFETRMTVDFPEDELRPLENILSLIEDDEYFMLGYFEENALMAYASFAMPKGSISALLDYYAVLENARGTGIGGDFLCRFEETLKPMGVDHIVLEVERLDCANSEKEVTVRKRRIRFYENNSCKMSNVVTKLFGVDFSIMVLPFDKVPSDNQITKDMESFYKLIVTPMVDSKEEYEKQAQIDRLQ